jgi:hypothetical protein
MISVNVPIFAKCEDPFKPESDMEARPFLSASSSNLSNSDSVRC